MARPPATTLATCPATLTPMACWMMKLVGSSFRAIFGDDPSGNGEGADAAGPDHGIDLFLQEQVGQFGEEQAPHRIENEGHGPQGQDLQHLDRQDIFGGHGGPYGDPQQQGHQVGQFILGTVGQAVAAPRIPSAGSRTSGHRSGVRRWGR